jgi:site-specific DNA-methyltransferase (adenine-specific)
MTPFYDQDGITIHNGKWEDVLPSLPKYDLVFTSPPYNLGVSSGGGFGHYNMVNAGLRERGGGGKWNGGALADGYDGHADRMPLDEYEAWQKSFLSSAWDHLNDAGAIYYNHKPRVQSGTLWTPLRLNPGLPLRQIIIWARAGGVNFAPTHYVPTHEWILVLASDQFRLKSKAASGAGDVWYVPQEANKLHPAPFPVTLPARAIETTGASSVLDPHCGIGSTLVAAKMAGVKAVGIERSKRYCEIAASRLSQGALFGSMAS